MQIIALKGIPCKWDQKSLLKMIGKVMKGHIQGIALVPGPRFQYTKIAYLKIPKNVDAGKLVNGLNSINFKKAAVIAEVCLTLPKTPLTWKQPNVSSKLKRKLKIPESTDPGYVLSTTHGELLMELQYKYTGLVELSEKSKHQLLLQIARTLLGRLKYIVDKNGTATSQGGFHLSKLYRKVHPHDGDFQMILSTLHSIEDSAGMPRSQIEENELISAKLAPKDVENISTERMIQLRNKYSDKITNKIVEHISSLDVDDQTNVEELGDAQKRVRQELKNLLQHMPTIIKQTIADNTNVDILKHERARVYGEPYLPLPDQLNQTLMRFKATKIHRSDRLYNILRLNIPKSQFQKFMTVMDGKVIGGGKLIIRPSEMPVFKIPLDFINEMKDVYGIDYKDKYDIMEDGMQEDDEGETGHEEMDMLEAGNAEPEWNESW
ncbi:uncharacterized protein LOC131841455 [Achroia grisella]|uniref:uncharacterized protein LOC131841455 n=1 Tax=Achroia grisella TaxID=688607 RepID=UPI0027D304E9|nr:uncharacterized protein LOC131841455 [Achroia grisella]